MSQIEIEETTETIEVIMLEKLIELAKQVGRLGFGYEVLLDEYRDDSCDEDSDDTIVDCADMSLRELIELEFTDEQLVDVIAETRAELADDAALADDYD